MKVYIRTFGNFDIIYKDEFLIEDKTRQYRLYRLLQYFITYRNKKISIESIIDNILVDNESVDPKGVLRTQIFRLRQIMKNMIPESENQEDYMSICFSNGYYIFKTGEKIVVDADEFESLIDEGDSYVNSNLDLAVDLYIEALKLCEGLYLQENTNEIWITPTRNYYNRLYLKTFNKLIIILEDKDKFEEIIELCEKALSIYPYEEAIHINLMESMINCGYIASTAKHFEYTKIILEKEFGIKASPRLNDIQKKIKNCYSYKNGLDLDNLYDNFNDIEEGALECSIEDFKVLCNLAKRKSTRGNEYDFICTITLNNTYNGKIDNWTEDVSKVLKSSLRSEDTFTFWNDSQVILLLHNVKGDGLEKIEKRIRKNLGWNGNDITMEFKPVAGAVSGTSLVT